MRLPIEFGMYNQDVGEENGDATHATDNAPHDHITQRSLGHHTPQQVAEPSEAHLDPLLGVTAECEGRPEH